MQNHEIPALTEVIKVDSAIVANQLRSEEFEWNFPENNKNIYIYIKTNLYNSTKSEFDINTSSDNKTTFRYSTTYDDYFIFFADFGDGSEYGSEIRLLIRK